MNSAIRYRRNFSKANTSVRCFKTNGVTTDVDVFLHGNHIASLDTATHRLTIKDGGWQSVTTKSRLNALLDEFAPSMGIFQKDWVWYLSDRLSGSVVPFISGMTVLLLSPEPQIFLGFFIIIKVLQPPENYAKLVRKQSQTI